MNEEGYKKRIAELENKIIEKNDEEFWANQELESRNLELKAYEELLLKKKNDLTKEILLRKNAEHLSDAKTQFLSIMSHEIRTPMNGVIGMTNLLLDTNLNSEQKTYAEIIESSGQILLNVINDILDFSKIESGNLLLENNLFKSIDIIKEPVVLLNSIAKDKQIEIIYDIDVNMPEYIYGDFTRIKQVVINLLNNAIKFTEFGKIKVNLKVLNINNDEVEYICSVIDSGIGISKENLSKIFIDFTQADLSTTRKYGGTGLGLTICKKLIEQMGGEINVKSQLKKGSTFVFKLKTKINFNKHCLVVDENNTRNEKLKLNINLSDSIPLKILLVEDNQINQKLALMLFKKMGYKDVILAQDGLEAVESVKINHFDVIFMDCQMPNMNGFDSTKAIRKMEINIPIIAMTANAMPEDEKKCYESGMDYYITKPINVTKLQKIIKYLK